MDFLEIFCVIFFAIAIVALAQSETGCLQRKYGNGKLVCVCNSDHCDYFSSSNISRTGINVITSTKNGERFSKSAIDFNTEASSENLIVLNRSRKYQKIVGFGGAFTDAACINIKSLPDGAKENLMRSYFSELGSNYDLCRVPMGGTDFSTHGYSYSDTTEADPELKNFQLADEDLSLKIPLILEAKNLSRLKLYASTWIAPKWMKENGEYSGFGGKIKEEYYQTWADYFLKFFENYSSFGINFWGVSTGNEPSLNFVPLNKIPSVQWSPKEASVWVREHLGPTIRNSTFADIKIIGVDDQRIFLDTIFLDQLLGDNSTRNFVDGLSAHWYYDKIFPTTIIDGVREKYPEKFVFVGEASNGWLLWEKAVVLGSWERGEKYAADIIENLNNWAVGWIDWNMALDPQGGPTYIDNNVDSPIIVNATSGEFYKQPMYYTIGHFSKFLPENSIRIDSENNSKIPLVVFERPDGCMVAVMLNKGIFGTKISIQDGEKFINLNLAAKSITTTIWCS